MNKQEKYLAYVVIGIVALAGVVVGINSQMADADISNESKAEMFNHMNDVYVTKTAFDKYKSEVKDEDAIPHTHVEFDAIGDRFASMEKAHRNLMAMVVTEETTTSTTSRTGGIFSLETDPQWTRGELITVTGVLQVKSTLEATITHETAEYKRTFNVAVFDDRSFTMPFALASDDPLGEYIVTFKSSGKFDSISFEAIE
ncbi:hypothetical protein IIB34_05865 [PVC group bacterium]|nr:hypothetical protein [PVC group bacterium]